MAPLHPALAECGVTEADWELIEQARALIAEVNANLAARDSAVLFVVSTLVTLTKPGARVS